MSWTEKQLQAIESHGKNLLVSAAAGSGKTAVLTERILRLITERRIPVKELLVVTFTEAAASEMKSRIASSLTMASENDTFANSQLRQLGSAKIMTFHAFCLTILKRYYYTIDLDPSFTIADDKRAEALREEAADEVIAAAFADQDDAFKEKFLDFLLTYADVRSEKKVRDLILSTYEFIMNLPDPWVWLKESVDALFVPAGNVDDTPAIKFANSEVSYMLANACLIAKKNGETLTSLGLTNLAAKNAIDMETLSQIETSFKNGDKAQTKELIENISFEVFRATKDEKETYEGIKQLITLRRDQIKKIIKKDIGSTFFSQTDEEYKDEIAFVAPYARILETLVKRFADVYTEKKRKEKIVDFADFEHMALKILEDENIAEDYRRRFSSVFIDEYQDSNYVQEALISRLSRGDNVFMVGDVKQSIYSFRNAAPEIFLAKQKSFKSTDDEGTIDLRIDLSMNYRSKASVINAVNAVFETIMESHYSGMDYDEDARLKTGISYDLNAEGKTKLHLIQKDSDREIFSSDAEGEATLCAEIIKDTVGKEFFDAKKGEWRTIRYSDIVILLRTAKDTVGIYQKILEKSGIPAVADRGEGYFETVEVDTFLALLRAIVNLRRDVPLAAAMCSVVFGFNLSELADIRSGNMNGFFYTAFIEYAENGRDALLREKCENMTQRLSRWRDEERFMRLDDFLWKLMRESGFYDYAGKLSRAGIRQANLRALLDRAANFQSGRVEGLREFLAWLEKLKDRGGTAQVTLLSGADDVCRIKTIHGSKGLEFPVVILGGLGKSLTLGGRGDDTLLFNREVGLSLQWRDKSSHTYKKTLLHKALKLKKDISERAEIIRLLYVAMTRAMDSLHMIGTMGDPEKWAEVYSEEEASPDIDTNIFGASTYLDLLLPAIMKRKDIFDFEIYDSHRLGEILPITSQSEVADSEPQDSEDILPFTYPYTAAVKLKSKYSVTELNRNGSFGSINKDQPFLFMEGGLDEAQEDAGLTSAEKGSALHKAFELLDIANAYGHRDEKEWFVDFLNGLTASRALSSEEVAAIKSDDIRKFANSNLAERIVHSDFMVKEAPFNMKLPFAEASNEAELIDEEIVVQGVIDCLFQEDDGIVVVDYKSGWFNLAEYESEADRIRSAYGHQLKLYRKAAELIFNKPVKESLIYMTNAGVTIDL